MGSVSFVNIYLKFISCFKFSPVSISFSESSTKINLMYKNAILCELNFFYS